MGDIVPDYGVFVRRHTALKPAAEWVSGVNEANGWRRLETLILLNSLWFHLKGNGSFSGWFWYAKHMPLRFSPGSLRIGFVCLLVAVVAPWDQAYPVEARNESPALSVSESPVIGAIRWDAWYGSGGVTQAVEKSLGQPKYHYRLPWFAKLLGEDKVRIDGDSDEIMAREIDYASQAGLDYWAFLHYWEDSRELGIGLKRYLAAKEKRGVRYCLLEEGGRLDKLGTSAWPKIVEHFKSGDYQTVLGGRPLLLVYVKTMALGRNQWDELKRQTVEAGLNPPYLVLMGWDAAQDAKDMAELGFDAVSAYARGGAYSMEQPSYAEQGRLLKASLWDRWEKQRTPCVTLASAGWDTRPRNERPPSWIRSLVPEPAPDPTPFSEQKPLIDSVTATPEQLASHFLDAIQWTKAHRDLNVANTIIVYAWNEHDEGGWLQPTLAADGSPNEERIQAVGRIFQRPLPPGKQ